MVLGFDLPMSHFKESGLSQFTGEKLENLYLTAAHAKRHNNSQVMF